MQMFERPQEDRNHLRRCEILYKGIRIETLIEFLRNIDEEHLKYEFKNLKQMKILERDAQGIPSKVYRRVSIGPLMKDRESLVKVQIKR